MTDSGDESSGTEHFVRSYPGLPIPYSVFKQHVRRCKQPECFHLAIGRLGRGKLLADAGDRSRNGPHWIQLCLPRVRSVVHYPEEQAHEGHSADRESVLLTHASLRLTCSCSSPPCCLPSLLERLCAAYNSCSFDHYLPYHRGHLSADHSRYYMTFGTLSMAPSKVKLVSALIKTMGLLLAMLIAGLVGYLARPCAPCRTIIGGPNASAAPSQPLTFTLDTGTLSGLEIVLLCAILAVTLGALACLFRPTLAHLMEKHLFTPNLPTTTTPLLPTELAQECAARWRRRGSNGQPVDEEVDLGGGGPEGVEHQMRPPSPMHVRLN